MNIVLVEPEIPPNTGNVARLCAAAGARLHLIEPLGFKLDDRTLKRAGMDYWEHVVWQRWDSWDRFCSTEATGDRLWLVESGGGRPYSEVRYAPGDYLVFGRETLGLPKSWLETAPERWIHIPMLNPAARSLNLANCVAIVLFEALRQNEFRSERR